ncbi:MAG: aminoglycoside phosphotransferase family protein [Pseudomonadota bacterium]|nr:aminoglycoside phosphotransferase family protein [Pseudomonadota bacterium]
MMHSDQIYIDADIAREMLFEQFPQYRQDQIKAVGSGTVNAIFKIGSVATARFPLRGTDPIVCVNMLRNEAKAMTRFAEKSPVAAPRPVGLGQPGLRYPMPWAVQSWVEGDVATPDGLAESTTFALDVANLIATMRSAKTDGQQFDGQGRGGCLSHHDKWMSVCFANSEGLLNVPRLRSTWARLREMPPSGSDVMSHRDLIPSNLLVRGGRLVGVLDSGSFGPADPALDLVCAWHLFNHNQREVIRARLASSEVEWKRGAAWAFEQAMGLVGYYQNNNRVMSELGRSTLSRILSDPEI